MSATAIVLMLVAIIVIWGGLTASIIHLVRSTPRGSAPTDTPET